MNGKMLAARSNRGSHGFVVECHANCHFDSRTPSGRKLQKRIVKVRERREWRRDPN